MRLAVVLSFLLFAVTAQASRLAPTPDALHRERTAQLEQQLTRLLTALPAVERCELQLQLPYPLSEPLDAPPSPPRATVLVVGAVRHEDVARILQTAVPNLAADRITLIENAPKAVKDSTSFVQVGPFRVHPSSAVGLRFWLTISLLANVVLAGAVLSRLRRA